MFPRPASLRTAAVPGPARASKHKTRHACLHPPRPQSVRRGRPCSRVLLPLKPAAPATPRAAAAGRAPWGAPLPAPVARGPPPPPRARAGGGPSSTTRPRTCPPCLGVCPLRAPKLSAHGGPASAAACSACKNRAGRRGQRRRARRRARARPSRPDPLLHRRPGRAPEASRRAAGAGGRAIPRSRGSLPAFHFNTLAPRAPLHQLRSQEAGTAIPPAPTPHPLLPRPRPSAARLQRGRAPLHRPLMALSSRSTLRRAGCGDSGRGARSRLAPRPRAAAGAPVHRRQQLLGSALLLGGLAGPAPAAPAAPAAAATVFHEVALPPVAGGEGVPMREPPTRWTATGRIVASERRGAAGEGRRLVAPRGAAAALRSAAPRMQRAPRRRRRCGRRARRFPPPLPSPPPPPPPRPAPAVGDLHGDLDKTVASLKLARVIEEAEDGSLSWAGGDTVVVQLGDVLDRGNTEIGGAGGGGRGGELAGVCVGGEARAAGWPTSPSCAPAIRARPGGTGWQAGLGGGRCRSWQARSVPAGAACRSSAWRSQRPSTLTPQPRVPCLQASSSC
jgi:hypothetical protein